MLDRLFPARQSVVIAALASLIAAPAIGTAAPPGINLTLGGTGTGTVTSNPVGIACPATACQADFAASTNVTLTAVADSGSVFSGWNGACASAGLSTQCTLAIAASIEYTQVGATFDLATAAHTLTVTNTDPGLGKVLSSPGLIDCGSTCSDDFTPPVQVTLTAVPEVGYALQSWGGGCSGDDPCYLQMDGPKSVTASFEASHFSLNPASSQTFTPEIRYSNVAWGDYDNDGDLDVVVTGATSTGSAARTVLYRNDAGSFVDSGQTLKQLAGFATWGDYDNDGDLDLVIGGYDASTFGGLTQLYRNDGGTLTPVPSAFAGVRDQAPAGRFADYDQDGDLDFAIAGPDSAGQPMTRIYRNDGGTFVDINAGLTGSQYGELAWGDYDNDGDLDLIVVGNTATNVKTTLYENDNGTFVNSGAGIVDVGRASVDWADFDADGDLDLAIKGLYAGGLTVRIYRNDGAGTFVDLGAALPTRYIGVVRWGDANGDGYPDLLLTGSDTTGDQIQTQLFLNDYIGSGTFVEVQSGLPDIFRGAAEWGDYDNDGRLDVFLAGSYTQGTPSKDVVAALRNTAGTANVAPPAPIGLAATGNGAQLELSWTAPAGDETPAAGLTYNVRVGTTPGGSDVVAPMAEASTGLRRVPRLGNAGPNTTFTLKGVPPGTYYWAVQAIDASFAGSAFADGGSVVQPVLQLSIGDATLKEGNCGNTDLVFNVTLTGGSPGGVSVEYQTQDGSATAGQDYEATSGTLTFVVGDTSEEIRVPLSGDTTVESDETFTVVLSGPTIAAIADGAGVGSLLNDDRALQPGEEVVTWTTAVGVTTCGFDLVKTTSAGWGNGGAVSTQQITTGDGYVEFTASESNTYRMIGLGNGNLDASYQDIDFAVYLLNGTSTIYEKGVNRGNGVLYVGGDVFRVAVQGGAVTYSKNGAVFYTSLQTPVYPLLVDTSFYTQGSSAGFVVIAGETAPPPPPVGAEAVVWTSLVGVEAAGNSLTKTASAGWGNGGAVSAQKIKSGDGYVEFTASESNTFRMVGLSSGNQDASYQDIDFAVYLLNGTSSVYEKGINRGNGVPYVGGDVFRVAVQAGVVTYSKNGAVFYTSSQTPAYPLLVDTSFYTQGSTASFVVISGVTEPVVWTSLVGVDAIGSSLTKTASAGWGNGGAVSTQQITSGDGFVEFTATESNTFRMVGLSSGNQDASYQDIDFAVYLLNGTTLIYEKGIDRGNGVPYVGGDVFRVTVQGGVVRYSKNGAVFYTSSLAPAYPLLVDTSFYTQGSTASSVVISGETGPPPPPPGTEAVVWTSLVGVEAANNSLTKTASAGWGNGGAVSTQQITSGDGFVEFTATESNTFRMVGLSSGNQDASYQDIDFAVYLLNGTTLIYEKGINRGNGVPYVGGDVFRVTVQGGVVTYSKNGTVFYTSLQTPVYPLLVDTSFYTQGSTASFVVISGM